MIMKFALIALLLAIPAVMLVTMVIRVVARRDRPLAESRGSGDEKRRCLRCGYDLYALAVPRCPECGVMVGFEKTMAEIGLTEDEIRSIENRPMDNNAATNTIESRH